MGWLGRGPAGDCPSTLRAGSCAIDFTQLGHQKCFGTK